MDTGSPSVKEEEGPFPLQKHQMVPLSQSKNVSVLVAHHLTLVREGFAALCREQPQYRVVAQCAEGATALRLIESKPDIAILDLNLPVLFTLEIVRKVREAQISTRIVILSTSKNRKTVVEALRAGVNAFLLKSNPADQLRKAFEQVFAGGIYISPSLEIDEIFSRGQKSTSEDPFAALSPREYQVFSLFVEGTRAKEIGARLCLNPKTIDTYHANLIRKLDTQRCRRRGQIRYQAGSDIHSVRHMHIEIGA